MDRLSRAQRQLREMERMAKGTSPVHRLHPLCRLAVTITYIFVVVSFDKYVLSALTVMVLYPVVMFQAAGLSVRECFYRLRFVQSIL